MSLMRNITDEHVLLILEAAYPKSLGRREIMQKTGICYIGTLKKSLKRLIQLGFIKNLGRLKKKGEMRSRLFYISNPEKSRYVE